MTTETPAAMFARLIRNWQAMSDSCRDDGDFSAGDTYAQCTRELVALLSRAAELNAAITRPVAEGMVMVPREPTPEILAAAAVAIWPMPSQEDLALARKAAPMVLMQMDAQPGATVESIAAAIATMAPAYRAMIAAPQLPASAGDGGGK